MKKDKKNSKKIIEPLILFLYILNVIFFFFFRLGLVFMELRRWKSFLVNN
jgi:hypothetical protein